ncbi:MAG TPA: TrmH family RNA methyltransferase [Candidatus Nanoarchaeia archaeon]|nr:TrmH family RNA methyltransferase [Candidatus Nanoarchaeia archaeon]
MQKQQISVVLHDIRSSHNVGSMFRTADALGIDKIYLSGYTPAPKDKFQRINTEIAKVALGAEQTIPWESVKDVSVLIEKLRLEKNTIIAVEQHADAKDYKDFKVKGATVFIFGNEVEGISEDVLSQCDGFVEIPMRGKKESLNVSVAFGVALARILDL